MEDAFALTDPLLASLISQAIFDFTCIIILVSAHNQFWEALLNSYQVKVEAIVIEAIGHWKGLVGCDNKTGILNTLYLGPVRIAGLHS